MCCFHQEWEPTRVSPHPLCLLTDLYWRVWVITSCSCLSSDIVCWRWIVLADVEKVFRGIGDGVSFRKSGCVRICKRCLALQDNLPFYCFYEYSMFVCYHRSDSKCSRWAFVSVCVYISLCVLVCEWNVVITAILLFPEGFTVQNKIVTMIALLQYCDFNVLFIWPFSLDCH